MYDICVSSDELKSKSEYQYKQFTIEISRFYSVYYDVKYFSWNIILNDGSTYGMYHGGFETENAALIDAKKTIDKKFIKDK